MSEIWLIIIAVLGSFLAGYIDAVVGGGGLIQVPLLFILFPSIQPINVIATNRFASVAGTLVAARSYVKQIPLNWKAVLFAGIFATVSSFGGTFLMKSISPQVFKPILLVVLIALAVYTFVKKNVGQVEQVKYKQHQFFIAFSVIGLVMGFYNGVIGPGTGTLLVFSLVHFIGLHFLNASAYAKVINAIADLASLIAFIIQSAVLYKIAIPMMFTNMLGSYVGSKMALQKGNGFIRVFFMIVLGILIIRFAWDVFKP